MKRDTIEWGEKKRADSVTKWRRLYFKWHFGINDATILYSDIWAGANDGEMYIVDVKILQ